MDMTQIATWVRQADAIFATPIVGQMLVPLLKLVLPSMGVTPEQMATLDRNYADLDAREAEARRRAAGQ